MKGLPRGIRHTLALAAFSVACSQADVSPQLTPDDGCTLLADGSVSGAMADVCTKLAERARLLIGDSVVPGRVALAQRAGFAGNADERGWLLEWPRPDSGKDILQYYRVNILPHEAAHQMFHAYLLDMLRPSDGHRYGSIAPDWFDEATAIWAESDSMRSARLTPVRGTTPALAAVLTMPHPNLGHVISNAENPEFQVVERVVTPPCQQCTWLPDSLRSKYEITSKRVFPNGRMDRVVHYSATHPDGQITAEERHFYALSYSVLLYLHTRGGAAAFRELVARYREDPTPRASVLNGLPGLPDTFAEIERDWHQFLRQH